MKSLSRGALLAGLKAGRDPAAPFRLDVDGGGVPMAFRRGTRPCLLVIFHGAVNRAKRPIPYLSPFNAAAAGGAHQLSISDPSIERPGEFAASWYCGHAGLALQSLLPPLLHEIAAALGVRRRVYLGASSGGFAALHYSWHDPGSVAVAANPQTDFGRYIQPPVTRYRTGCWPEVETNAELGREITCDLIALYAGGFPNSVVYIQNTGDLRHLQNQFAPFLAALPAEGFKRLVCAVGFWGIHGHSGSIPADVHTAWTRAAVEAKSTKAESILDVYHARTGVPAPKERTAAPAPDANRDVRLAAALADFYRRPHEREG